METPYAEVLAALVLDTKLAPLLDAGRHWDITLAWDARGLSVSVRDQHDPAGRTFSGHS